MTDNGRPVVAGRPIRALQLITALGRGGAEQFLVNLARVVDRNLVHLEVAYLSAPDDHASSFESAGAPLWRIDAKGWLDLAAVLRLAGIIRARRYDIVNCHLPRAEWYGALATASASRVKLVITKHGHDERFLAAPARALHLFTAARADLIIAISEHMADVTRRLGAPRRDIVVCRYGIPVKGTPTDGRSVMQGLDIPDDAFIVGCIGRLRIEKGQGFLLRAMAEVVQTVSNAVLVLVGDGPDRNDLQRLALTLGLEARVRFLGLRADVLALASAFDVFVLPSLSEGLGLVLLEAMSQRCPIVASDLPAVREVVGESGCAVLVRPADSSALARALVALAANGFARREMGERGFARVLAPFHGRADGDAAPGHLRVPSHADRGTT